MFGRMFRMWLYRQVCEEAAAHAQAALWMPTKQCIACHQPILSNSQFCSICGSPQQNTDPLTVTAVVKACNARGIRPMNAYKWYQEQRGGGFHR